MNKLTLITCLACLMFPLSALAIDPGPSSQPQHETELWLNLQPSKQALSPVAQKASPAERELALQRWLKSYEHAIPEYFEQDVGGNSSGK